MTMKTKDLSVSTALLIQGYLRANGEESLSEALAAIRLECSDWAENLAVPIGKDGNALEQNDISVNLSIGGADVSRTPYNLISAAVALAGEAVDVGGLEMIPLLVSRLQAVRS